MRDICICHGMTFPCSSGAYPWTLILWYQIIRIVPVKTSSYPWRARRWTCIHLTKPIWWALNLSTSGLTGKTHRGSHWSASYSVILAPLTDSTLEWLHASRLAKRSLCLVSSDMMWLKVPILSISHWPCVPRTSLDLSTNSNGNSSGYDLDISSSYSVEVSHCLQESQLSAMASTVLCTLPKSLKVTMREMDKTINSKFDNP